MFPFSVIGFQKRNYGYEKWENTTTRIGRKLIMRICDGDADFKLLGCKVKIHKTDEWQDTDSRKVSKVDECGDVADRNLKCRSNMNTHLSSNKVYIIQKNTKNWFSIYPISSQKAECKLKRVSNVSTDKPEG